MLPPNSTIGIIGGGQLGRMLAIAAAQMGYRTHIFSPEPECPAAQVANTTTVAEYDNRIALTAFVATVDVVTFEFENIPAQSIALLEQQVAVYPSSQALATCRHRLSEKRFIQAQDIMTAPFEAIKTTQDIRLGLKTTGLPAILKTCEMGYDGKGQYKITEEKEAEYAFDLLKTEDAILEGFVAFEREISVIVARTASGDTQCFPPVHNIHEHHILAKSIVPAGIALTTQKEALRIAEVLANALNIVGLLAVEMFVMPDGTIIVNELAPRPHNSGHWSIDGAHTSQFEQHIRAIAGWPLGDTSALCPSEMHNLIGDQVNHLGEYSTNSRAHIHLYGKRDAREGRKMGHVNILKSRMQGGSSYVAGVGDSPVPVGEE